MFFLNTKEQNYNWSEISIDWESKQKFMVSLALCKSGQEDCQEFFKYLLKAGIPLSLWNRHSNLEFTEVKRQFSKLITSSSLRNQSQLLQEVRRLRQKAHNQVSDEEAKNSLGYHLGVLCEHPERIPSWYNHSQGGDMLVGSN